MRTQKSPKASYCFLNNRGVTTNRNRASSRLNVINNTISLTLLVLKLPDIKMIEMMYLSIKGMLYLFSQLVDKTKIVILFELKKRIIS